MSDAAPASNRQNRPTAWTPLVIPIIRTAWLASLASNIGIWLGNVGTAWLMTELRPTPVMVALVQAATPASLFVRAARRRGRRCGRPPPPAGYAADRVGRFGPS